MDKAIEIKRRAQRCIQLGDLDGALSEYEKLVEAAQDADPYNYVLLADLLFKKNEPGAASERYLHAVAAYEKAGLYKNAIAVCKKMARLQLSAPVVLKRLGALHALDGLGTEASLYYQQYSEILVRDGKHAEAAESLHLAFEACSDSLKVLEKAADAHELAGDTHEAARAWAEAAQLHQARGAEADAARCASRAEALEPGVTAASPEPQDDPEPVVEPASLDDEPLMEAIETNSASLNGRSSDGMWAVDDEPPALQIERVAVETREIAGTPGPDAGDAGELAGLLRRAHDEFQSGDREAATATLLDAAQRYETQGEHDSAATIYRSLSRGSVSPETVLTRWLANAEARHEDAEAADVSGRLGELAVAAGNWDAATTWFERALEHDPGNELARRRLERLRPEAAAPQPAGDAGRISLGSGRSDATAPELETLLAEFQRSVETHIAGDAQSQYDLGMTYREMGLMEQAIASFRQASADRAFGQRCAELIGRCLLDEGRIDEAIQEFETALSLPSFSSETLANLRFQLGLAYEAAGRHAEALDQFEQVHAVQPGFPEAAQKIRQLKRAPGNS